MWLDSTGRNHWEDATTYLQRAAEADLSVISIGHVVFESEDRVCLVMNLAPNAMDMMMIIPKRSIISRALLTEG